MSALLAKRFTRWRFLKNSQQISITPLKKAWSLIFHNFEYPLPKGALCKFGWNWPSISWRCRKYKKTIRKAHLRKVILLHLLIKILWSAFMYMFLLRYQCRSPYYKASVLLFITLLRVYILLNMLCFWNTVITRIYLEYGSGVYSRIDNISTKNFKW